MYLGRFPLDKQTCHLNMASCNQSLPLSLCLDLSFPDGWTKTDLIYVWKSEGALQFADNLSLPGGFLLANTGNQYCDVITSTGRLRPTADLGSASNYFLFGDCIYLLYDLVNKISDLIPGV